MGINDSETGAAQTAQTNLPTESTAPKDLGTIAKEIVATQTAFFFWGVCAHGTKFPNNLSNPVGGDEVIAGGSDVDQKYYGKTVYDYDPKAPFLHYAGNIERSAFPDVRTNSKTIVLSHIPSEIPNMDEVVISGKSETTNDRSDSITFTLIERISSSSAKTLFETLKENPEFFEIFYQTVFPDLDSSKEGYDGLWRLFADKIVLLEQGQLEQLARLNPAKPN